MKKLVLLLASMLVAGQAGAKALDWHGTLDVELWGGGATSLTFVGSGVATVNDSSGSAHLSTLRIANGISGSGTVPITDPETTGTVKTVYQDLVALGTGTISGISGAPPVAPGATIPIKGNSRVCIFQPNCSVNLPLDLTKNDGNTGVGVGGTVTLGGNGSIRISIQGAPWTLGTATLEHQTIGGNFEIRSRAGFVHGAASASNSSTATNSGVIQLITPQQVSTAGLPGNSTRQALFSTLTLHFIPEPGLLLLLASGAVGLGLLGRGRMKKE